ncbi:guanylate kinase [Alphaproteobacteria bacterium]|jgi:guanylate kinase|nr:guanylate kinase [Alphaproteobacteria bacterium]
MLDKSNRGLVLIISSPSGAGKTTICKKLIEEVNNLNLSVSVTTRLKRSDEVDGKDYFFRSDKEFDDMVAQEKFLEHAKVFDYSYGTLKSEIDTKIINGINVIVDIDWQGTRQIEQHIPDDIVKIFILPPSIKELEKRLGARATESQDSFKKRMSEARKEISHYSEYDFIIINEDIQESVNKIKTILYSESLRRHRQVGLKKFVDNLI